MNNNQTVALPGQGVEIELVITQAAEVNTHHFLQLISGHLERRKIIAQDYLKFQHTMTEEQKKLIKEMISYVNAQIRAVLCVDL